MKLQTDELNSQEFDAEEFIRDFFKPMRISEDRKEDRVETTKDIRDSLLFLFTLIAVMADYMETDWETIETQFGNDLNRIIATHGYASPYMNEYVASKISDFITTTKNNLGDDPYWLSDERATAEAANEANDIVGYKEVRKAIDKGYTQKKWVTQNDIKVRPSHMKMEGKTVPIKDFFVLDKGKMLYPHDFVNCPEETYNCRCAVVFL